MQFHLNDMVCDGCARSVTKAIQKIDPQAAIEIDVAEHRVDIASDQPEASFRAALAKAGFPPAAPGA